jgi:hypothetical protein
MKSEKANAGHIGSNTNLTDALTMNKDNSNQNKFQLDFAQPRRNLLESTKLPRLPERAKFPKFEMPEFDLHSAPKPAAICVNCKTKLDELNQPLAHARVCRKCICSFTTIEIELDEGEKRRRREMLEKFTQEVKR